MRSSRGWMCYWTGFLDSLINRNWYETGWGIQARLHWDLCYSTKEWEEVIDSLPQCPTDRGASFLNWVWEQGSVLVGESLRLVSLCPGGAVCSTLLLLQAPEMADGFWPLCILLFMICPSCTSRQVFVVPCSLFVFWAVDPLLLI